MYYSASSSGGGRPKPDGQLQMTFSSHQRQATKRKSRRQATVHQYSADPLPTGSDVAPERDRCAGARVAVKTVVCVATPDIGSASIKPNVLLPESLTMRSRSFFRCLHVLRYCPNILGCHGPQYTIQCGAFDCISEKKTNIITPPVIFIFNRNMCFADMTAHRLTYASKAKT